MRSYFALIGSIVFLILCLALLVSQRLRKKRTGQAADHLELRKQFRSYIIMSGILFSFIFISMNYFLTDITYNSSMQYFQDYLPDFAVYAGKKYFYFPLALCLSGVLIHPIAYLADKIFLSDRYVNYMRYTQQLYGFNLRQIGMASACFNLTFLIFFTSFLGSHLALDNHHIYFRNVLSFDSKVYEYKHLKKMTFSPSKRINADFFIAKPTLILEFQDGAIYTSEGALYDSWELKMITKNIEARTGISPLVEFE